MSYGCAFVCISDYLWYFFFPKKHQQQPATQLLPPALSFERERDVPCQKGEGGARLTRHYKGLYDL